MEAHFGSIINSAFPAGMIIDINIFKIKFIAGGMGLGKKKDSDKEKLNPKNVEKAADNGFDITSSEQL